MKLQCLLTESEEVSLLVIEEVHGLCGLLGVLLFLLSRHGVLEANNEVYLGGGTALVRPKHDGIGSLVLELGKKLVKPLFQLGG